MSKEKQIEEMACENCLHYKACLVNSEYVPSPCRAYENKAGYRKQEWISVEERLPEVGTRVVGYDYESNVRCYFITEGRWWIDEGWNTVKGWGITHWMPLPEAPKMKGGAE